MSLLSTVFAFVSEPFGTALGEVVKGWNERAAIKTNGKIKVEEAKIDAKVAQYQADAKRVLKLAETDADYDMQVLRNRERTIIDEVIITFFLSIFGFHFIPALQPYMADGWLALGYDGAPWWFEMAIVGILVSTLGLMRLFRDWKKLRETNS